MPHKKVAAGAKGSTDPPAVRGASASYSSLPPPGSGTRPSNPELEIEHAPTVTGEHPVVQRARRGAHEDGELPEPAGASPSPSPGGSSRSASDDEERDRVRREVLAQMSHDFRTPLNAIIGFAELVCDGHVDPGSPEHQEIMQRILRCARRLSEDVDAMFAAAGAPTSTHDRSRR